MESNYNNKNINDEVISSSSKVAEEYLNVIKKINELTPEQLSELYEKTKEEQSKEKTLIKK